MNTCSTCKHWYPAATQPGAPAPLEGKCKGGPPTRLDRNQHVSGWPWTPHDEFCGQWTDKSDGVNVLVSPPKPILPAASAAAPPAVSVETGVSTPPTPPVSPSKNEAYIEIVKQGTEPPAPGFVFIDSATPAEPKPTPVDPVSAAPRLQNVEHPTSALGTMFKQFNKQGKK